LSDNPRTRALLRHLAERPGHDEVKSDFRQLLVEEFGVDSARSISSAVFPKCGAGSTR
jgi:hypothetical protein